MKISKFKIGSSETSVHFNSSISKLRPMTGRSRVILVTDENVYAAHSKKMSGWDVIVLKAGEVYKVQETVDAVVTQLISMEADRETMLVGVGGGVISDLTGYIAAIYMRGIEFGFVPTTLLGLVDASIGGKNGIDIGPYKNMVGTIRQPSFILHDLSLLGSLPEKEWRNGMAEIIKHACIGHKASFEALKNISLSYLRKNRKTLGELVRQNAVFKMKMVKLDPFERGERKKLNFGHTLGHAIENQYEISHGEAISLGMMFAASISRDITGFRDTPELQKLLEKFGLPTSALFSKEKVFHVLSMDKKRKGSQIRFILLKSIGRAVIHPLDLGQVKEYLQSS
jgi:3-dehydroquinate synthase